MTDAAPAHANRWPRALRPLAFRGYRRIWFGAFVSNVGTWVETVAVGIYITQLTGKASWTGIVAAAGFLPGAVLGPLGGALADRIPRKVLLVVTTLVEALAAGLLAVLVAFDAASPIALTVIVFFGGAAGVISWPAYSAILPELVPREELPGAIGLSSAQWNLGRIIGPIVAGVVIAIGGYAWAFTFNALSFFAVIIAVLPIRIPRPGEPEHAFLRSIRAGFAFVFHERGIRQGISLFAINSFLTAPFIALVPAFAYKVFENESPGTSILVTAQGVGALVMAMSIGALIHRFGVRTFLAGVLFTTPVVLAAYALSPIFAVAALTITILGALYLGTLSGVATVAQTRTPSAIRGRVVAINVATLAVFYPIGSVTQGWLGDAIGLRETMLIAAGLLLVTLVTLTICQRGFAPGLDAPMVPGATGATPPPDPDGPIEMIPD